MLEEHVAYYLEKYLGNYVKGLSKEALNISVWKGNVELTNMQLKPEALNALKLPIKVKAGFLGSVKLKVPWSRLGKEPVIVLLDRIFILAEPETNVECEGDDAAVQKAKSRKVKEAETAMMEAKREDKNNSEVNKSWLGSLISTIIGNLKLSITNIHIRYEDSESNPGHPFAAGLTLEKLAAVTVDEKGHETFVTSGDLDRIQKAGELQGLAFYFDSDTKPWNPNKPWENLPPADWSKIFEPGIKVQPSGDNAYGGSSMPKCHYLLQPVGATARYTKLGTGDARTVDKEVQKATIYLDDVTLSLSQAQYRDILKLGESVSAFKKRLQYAHYRPAAAVKDDARSWWKYACRVIVEQLNKSSGHLSWEKVLRLTRLRKKYVSLYVTCLQSNPNMTTVDNNKEIQELDRELDADIIIQWRMLAHTYVDQNQQGGNHRSQQSRSSWWSFGWGNQSVADDSESMSLNDEDWKQLNQIIGYQEGIQSSILPGRDPPDVLHTVLEVQMRHNASKLVEEDGSNIIELSSEGLECNVRFYPEMKIFDLKLGSFQLSSPEGLLVESAAREDAVSGKFTYMPLDKSVDWSLSAKASPCYITYLKSSINEVVDFFQNSSAVSQTVALETAAALQATLDEVARSAQQQLNEVLKERPRFSLDLDIAAPKITIPSDFYPDGVHQSKLLLDLGYLTLQTEEGRSSESQEEMDLYMRFKLGLSDVQVFLVDGKFDWREHHIAFRSSSETLRLPGKCTSLPVLEKCGITMALQQICVSHPKYPSTRLAVRLPSLGFHFSPARYHRLMQILKVFQNSSSDDIDKSIRPWDPSDFEAEVSVLAWKGVGNREAVWQRRYLALAGPFLYILESPSSVSQKQRVSLLGKQVFAVPPESIGDVANVLAVCDAGQFNKKVAESVSALLLRFDNEDARENCQGRLQGAIYRFSSPAAVGGMVGSHGSGNDPEKAVLLAASAKHQLNPAEKEDFFLTGALDELKIVISSSTGGSNIPNKQLLLATENPLLELRALGSKVEFVMRKYDTSVGAVLQAFEVEDKFSSKESSQCRYLARSNITASKRPPITKNDNRSTSRTLDAKTERYRRTMSKDRKESRESFFDTEENLGESDDGQRSGQLRNLSRSSSEFYDAEDSESGELSTGKDPPNFERIPGLLPELKDPGADKCPTSEVLENFVKAQIILFSIDSPEYGNVDKQITVSLATLSFFCIRPTILALLDFTAAMTADISSGLQEPYPSDNDALVTTVDSGVINKDEDIGDSKAVFDRKDSVIKGLLGSGKDRAVFLLILNMHRAVVVLNSEDGDQIATLSQEDLHAEIKVFPSSFGITASLGNLRISDDSLEDGHPYNFICDMRNPGGTSFIELEFLSFNADDNDYDGYEYSLVGKLSEVRFVYLNRFIQELSAYCMGLVPQSSGYVVKLENKLTDVDKFLTQSEIEGSPAVKLDVSLTKPIIIMPRETKSTDFLELDILHISVKNSFQWIGGEKDDLRAVRLDTIALHVEDIHLAVGMKGIAGEGIIKTANGLSLTVRRPLRDLWHQVPGIDASIKIEELKADLSNKEYQVITECASSNFSEKPNLPPPITGPKADDNQEHSKVETETVQKVDDDQQHGETEAERDQIHEASSSDNKKSENKNDGLSAGLAWNTIIVTVSIDLVELSLFTGRSRDVALASMQVSGVWAAFKSNSVQESYVMATLETFSVKDDREGTEAELRYMIGKADDLDYFVSEGSLSEKYPINHANGYGAVEKTDCRSPSTMLVVDVKLSSVLQMVSLRIQQPRLLVAVDFLLAIAEFFIPSIHAMVSDGKDTDEGPIDGIYLNQPVYKQQSKETILSPRRPLIADDVAFDNYVYDGSGGSIRLLCQKGTDLVGIPEDPLIFIGNGKTLQFKNVVIRNGDFLDSCIFLGINSSYTALEDDEVFLEGLPENIMDEASQPDSSLNDTNDGGSQPHLDIPVKEITFNLQAIGPELTFYHRMSDQITPQVSERLLRAKMDVFSRFVLKGDDMELNAKINGLTLEASSGLNVLEPLDTILKYSNVSGKQNFQITLSEILTNFSFSVLQLVIRLQEDILTFLRVTTKQVTVQCNQFDRIWTHEGSGQQHITFWRPRAPPGFAILGDCITPLDEPLAKGVLALNMSLARVKRPVRFEMVWLSGEHQISESHDTSKKCSVWIPVPPTGYVALGCFATQGIEPPPLTSAVCVLEPLVTSCSMKDCILVMGLKMNEADASSAFWRVDNSIGSFFVVPNLNDASRHKPFELRHVAISHEFPRGQAAQPAQIPRISTDSEIQSQTQCEHISARSQSDISRTLVTGQLCDTVVCFKLVWWDKNSRSRKNISIWRPVLPAGCAFVGDLAVEGYEPPSLGLVLHDQHDGVLLKKPLQFQERGRIKKHRAMDGVSFWLPIAPPGYAVLGCIATQSDSIDPELAASVRCIRNDLVLQAQFASKVLDSDGLRHVDGVFSIWPVENEVRTFIVCSGLEPPPRSLALSLADQKRTSEPDNLSIDAEVETLSATFYDDFGGFMVPLLNLTLSGINASLHGRMDALRSTVNFSLTTMTYNEKYYTWEPCIEPFDGFVRYDYKSNSSDMSSNGAESQVRIVSTSNLNFNISVANFNMFLEAFASWNKLSESMESSKGITMGKRKSGRATNDGKKPALELRQRKSYRVVHHNKLGQDLLIQILDFNKQPKTVPLPAGQTASVQLPSSRNSLDPSLKGKVKRSSVKIMAIRIGYAELPYDSGIGGQQYMVTIRILPQVQTSDQQNLEQQSARTRCAYPDANSPSGMVLAHWDEVFSFEVEPGEINIAEMIVTDLAKGSPVGYCSFSLPENNDGQNVGIKQTNESRPMCAFEMKCEPLLPPQGFEDKQEGYCGKVSYGVYFFSPVHEGEMEPPKDQKSGLRPGMIQISYINKDFWVDVGLSYTAGATCWRLGHDTIATEAIVEDGNKQLIFRSLVVVVNGTDFSVDVALCLKSSASKGISSEIDDADRNPLQGLCTADEVFENERYQPLVGWGSSWPGHFLPTDPRHWSRRDLSCSTKEFPEAELPLGWEWTSNWHVDKVGAADEDGWVYAFDFRNIEWPPLENSKGPITFVRRRRWIRSRKCVSDDVTKPTVVGILDPGDSSPLPIASLRPTSSQYCLQVRPHEVHGGTPSGYKWSDVVLSRGQSGSGRNRQPLSQFSIHSLIETEELLCCAKEEGSCSTHAKLVWFFLDVQSKEIGMHSQLDPMRDWRVVILAPLILFNFLPVSSEYTVLEKGSGPGLVIKDRGVVGPGQEAQVFHADIRRALYLIWIPQGGWQPEHDAVLISHPYRQAARYIALQSFSTGRKLRVLVDPCGDGKEMVGKRIRFYVPCWLDVEKCPSIHCKLVEMKQDGKSQPAAEMKFDSHCMRSSKGEKVQDLVLHEEMCEPFTMVSMFNTETMGVSVALAVSSKVCFQPATPLHLLAQPEGFIELRALDDNGSSYHRILASMKLCPYQTVPTKVVMFRPYMTFTNRLGRAVYLKQNNVDELKILQPDDWRISFPLPVTDEPEKLQVRVDNTHWSLPFAIKQEETIHIAMRQETSMRQYLRVEVRGYEEGSRFLVVFRQGSIRGPYRLENRSKRTKIQYRQSGLDEGAWQYLQPHSTKLFAWEDPSGEKLLEVLPVNEGISTIEKYDLNKVGDHYPCEKGSFSRIYVRILEVGDTKVARFFDAYTKQKQIPHEEQKELSTRNVGSSTLVPAVTDGASTLTSSSHLEVRLELGQVGLSVIDLKPREVIYLYMEKFSLSYSTGYTGNISRIEFLLDYLQIDNQLPLTCMPVLLAPKERHALSDPVLKIAIVASDEKSEATEVYRHIGLRFTQSPWRINIHEPIIWAIIDFYNNLHLDRLSGGADVGQVDPEVRIDLIDTSEVRLKLTLETAPRQRPRGALGIWSPIVTTLGNTSKMPIHLRSVLHKNRYMRKSAILPAIWTRLRRDLIHNPLMLLSGVDVLGMTSSTLATLSESVAELSNDGKFLQLRSRQDRSRRIAGVSDGLLRGTEALAQGVAFGFSGVITKPLEQAKENGVAGFLQGLGKAVLGFVVQPMSGVLDFAALTVNGVGASCTRCFEIFERRPSFQRVRLPRAIRPDGILCCYDEKAATGQMIMQLAEGKGQFRRGVFFREPSKFAWSDFYVDHFNVNNRKIVMTTNKRVMLLQCPKSFTSADIKLTEPCCINWDIPWGDLLALEVTHGTNNQAPVYIVLHRRNISITFAQVVKCLPRNPEAGIEQEKLIQSSIFKSWKTYGPDRKTLLSQMSKKRQLRIAPTPSTSKRSLHSGLVRVEDTESSIKNSEGSSGSSNQKSSVVDSQRGDKNEIFSFEEIWTSEQEAGVDFSFCVNAVSSIKDVITIWRPIVPEGYVSVGDVAHIGKHPPLVAVAYKNKKGLFSPPTGFDLVWRSWKDGFLDPISIWMPRAPDGFFALGCVAIAAYLEPELDSVWCVHSSLVEEASFEEQEIWHVPNNSPWGCFLYQVASEALTFIAFRKPQQHTQWEPKRVLYS